MPTARDRQYDREVSERQEEIAASLVSKSASMWSAHAFFLLDEAGAPLPGEGGSAAERVSEIIVTTLGRPIVGPFDRVASGTFDLLAAMCLVCRWGGQLSDDALEHVRKVFTRGILDRGNTENHWLMHYTGNLLGTERWPGEEVWWNGLSREAMAAESRRWIVGTIRRTARWGHYEYDSPQYHLCHVLAMMALHEWSTDGEVAKLAGKSLDLLVADMALEHHNGAWAGGHSREGYRENTWTRSGSSPSIQYLYFGGQSFDPQSHHDHPMVGPALAAAYRPPAVLETMAWDRTEAHAVRKTKAPRAVYRHVDAPPEPTRKYTWMSPSYALGSTQVGLPGSCAGPIDLVSWDLTWPGDKHRAKLVCNHPYRDPLRFSAFLSGLPQTAGRRIATDKPYLQYPDRLFGASPYERMMQWEGTIIVLYRIPADDTDPYVNLYLPGGVSWVGQDGWLLADLESFYAALRVIGPYHWERIREDDHIDGWLVRIHDLNAGLVVEAAEASEVGSFEAFCEARTRAPMDLSGWPEGGRVAVTDTKGRHLTMEFEGQDGGPGRHRVDGQAIDYAAYPLYEAPGVEAPLGKGVVRFSRGGDAAELDFGIDQGAADMPMRVIG